MNDPPRCESCGTRTQVECSCCGRCAHDFNDGAEGRRRLDRRRHANGLAPLAGDPRLVDGRIEAGR